MANQDVKVVCYGVRPTEKPFFVSSNAAYNYQIECVEAPLTMANIDTARGFDAVLVRSNCDCKAACLKQLKQFNVKYILSRTVGVDHIDMTVAHELGFKVARVASYSPNAISELAFGLGMGFMRNLFYMANKNLVTNFVVDSLTFAKEVRNSTIGVIGTGKIGYEVAKAWKGMGAKVLGYDIYPSEKSKEVLTYVSEDEILAKSDLITVHCPYIKDQNHHMINKEFLAKMPKGAILINTARGALMDTQAVYDAVVSGQLKGVGLDVLEAEGQVFGHDFKGQPTSDATTNKLLNLYPRVVITPHVGSNTDEAVKGMAEISYANLADFLANRKCPNEM